MKDPIVTRDIFEKVDELPKAGAKTVFQGVEGAYSHAALLSCFGKDADCYCVPSFREVAEAVTEGRADYGVLPVENSSSGVVGEAAKLLALYDVCIVRDIYLPIRHCLLGLPGTKEEDIRSVCSHPQGLLQCAGFLEAHPGMQSLSVANTALAAIKVLEEQDRSVAAIASSTAAELYGLEIIREGINDVTGNTTRFVVISGRKMYRKDAGTVSILFELPHKTGSLFRMLTHISYNNLNMTKIASMPIPERPFEYRFVVGFEGNLADGSVKEALAGMEKEARALKILGCY